MQREMYVLGNLSDNALVDVHKSDTGSDDTRVSVVQLVLLSRNFIRTRNGRLHRRSQHLKETKTEAEKTKERIIIQTKPKNININDVRVRRDVGGQLLHQHICIRFNRNSVWYNHTAQNDR